MLGAVPLPYVGSSWNAGFLEMRNSTRRHVRRHDTFRDRGFLLAFGTQHELTARAPKDGQSGAGVCASQDLSS